MRSCSIGDQFIPWELSELCQKAEMMPAIDRGRMLQLCRSLNRWSQRQQRLVAVAQEAINQLQLDVRYLRFDLEATRRERDAFRAQYDRE
jgi:hypothetical protein